MKLSTQQLLHVQQLQKRILDSQDELTRFLNYVILENNGDPAKQYVLAGAELIEQTPVKLQ